MRYFTDHVQDQMESSLNHAIYYINQRPFQVRKRHILMMRFARWLLRLSLRVIRRVDSRVVFWTPRERITFWLDNREELKQNQDAA